MPLYVDVTEVVGIGGTTGVQRVVREIVRHGMASNAGSIADGGGMIPVIAVGGDLYRLRREGLQVLEPPSGARAAPAGRSVATRLKALLRQRAFGPFAVAQRIGFDRRLRGIARDAADPVPVKVGGGDVLVLIDTFWNGSSVLAAARRARDAGAAIALVVYDLFPIRRPEQVDPQLAHAFPRLLDRATALADGVLTISRQVTADVLDRYGAALPAERVRHFYLGQDSAAATGDAAASPQPFMTGPGRRYLMVGTLEPRRGHPDVLDAFDQLWAAGGEQKLLLIGKIGWRMEAFVARCRAHPRLNTHLFLDHDASDAALAGAVAAADAVIVASHFEGFGLPLVEALLAARPVLASDIPIFREIAPDTPLFFRAGDPVSLADALRLFEADPAPWRRRAAAFRWLDWNASARMFLDQMTAVLRRDPRQDITP